MKIECLKIKNFKAFKNVEMKDIPELCILVGANGSGKTTLFDIFGFLKDAMLDNVTVALNKRGGFKEVVSRNSTGAIEIEIKFRESTDNPLITYYLAINSDNGEVVIEREILKYRRGSKGLPNHFLDFSNGKGTAVTNELSYDGDARDLEREEQNLSRNDILAIKGLAQFKKFPAAVVFGNLIERWHVSDFHINQARSINDAGYAEHLSKEGDNLSLVTQFIYERHRNIFDHVLEKLKKRVPGISSVEAKLTDEGRVLLKFQDGSFKDPFIARFVSDGTIKMFAYLILLNDPKPHPLLSIEEPENQLYPKLLTELAEEFRGYAIKGGQVLGSTHSPDFLNAADLEEVFWLVKRGGYTTIHRAKDDKIIADLMSEGDKMGFLWKQVFFRVGRSNMKHLVFLLEEESAKQFIDNLLPRVFPDLNFRCIAFEGKQDLERNINLKLRGYKVPNIEFVILRDEDAGYWKDIKHNLKKLCNSAKKTNTLIRIARKEIGAWYFGDLKTVEKALKINNLKHFSKKKKYRAPDEIVNPKNELKKITRRKYNQVSGSRDIANYIDYENNTSCSFQVFLNGVRNLLNS